MGRRGRRRQRDHEFDDTLERDYSSSNKRIKGDERHENHVLQEDASSKLQPTAALPATVEPATPKSCNVDDDDVEAEATRIERSRSKNKLRKERKKEKIQERLKVEKEKHDVKTSTAKKATPPDSRTLGTTQTHDVVSCRKGVQYQDIVLGKGPMVQDRKKIHVKYTLRKQNATGKILDSSDMFGFRIGKGEVIQGWDIGLEGMKQGGIRHLLIPPEAGYGQKDIGAGKGGMLFFKVTLLAC